MRQFTPEAVELTPSNREGDDGRGVRAFVAPGYERLVSRTKVRSWLSWAERNGFSGRGWVNEPGAVFVIATNDTPLQDDYVRLGRRSHS